MAAAGKSEGLSYSDPILTDSVARAESGSDFMRMDQRYFLKRQKRLSC